MLRILLVYYEPQPSGQTKHVLSLARGLDKDKYAITVILPDHLHHSISEFNSLGVSVVPLQMGKILWSVKSFATVVRLVKEEHIDIVHVHSQEAGILTRIIAYLAGARNIIYTPQCTNIRRSSLFWLYRLMERFLSTFTDKIVFVSEHDRKRIIQWGISPSKVVVIKNGIDPILGSESPDIGGMKRKLGLVEEQTVVMQVGRFSYQKNPINFLKGVVLVIDSCPDVQFVMVGDGPLRGEVEKYIQDHSLEDHVHCLGWQEDADQLIAIADVITLTSRWEGLPYVLLEAMAWSRPVVATAVNGCPEVVEHGVTGFLVPYDDINSWANYVIQLLGDADKAGEMGRQGYLKLKEEFSLEKMVEQMENLYDSITLN